MFCIVTDLENKVPNIFGASRSRRMSLTVSWSGWFPAHQSSTVYRAARSGVGPAWVRADRFGPGLCGLESGLDRTVHHRNIRFDHGEDIFYNFKISSDCKETFGRPPGRLQSTVRPAEYGPTTRMALATVPGNGSVPGPEKILNSVPVCAVLHPTRPLDQSTDPQVSTFVTNTRRVPGGCICKLEV
jgi:hypothetical protein